MHTCNVITSDLHLVKEQERRMQAQRIASPAFLEGCQRGAQAVLNAPYHPDVRWYQDEFCLPMKRNIFSLLSIPVKVNQRTCQFLVDTGAQISGIRSQCVNRLSLRKSKGALSVGSIGGKEKVLPGHIADSLLIGAMEYHQAPLVELNDQEFTLRFAKIDLMGFDGILSWDILSMLDFEMDDIAKRFKVVKNRFRFPHENMIAGSFPVFLCHKTNGAIAVFGFDSGSKVSWLSETMIQQDDLRVVCEGQATGFGVHGMEKLPMKIVDRLELFLDRAQLTLRDTMSGRCDLFPGFTFDGVLGNEIFKGRRIRIVNSRRVVLLV